MAESGKVLPFHRHEPAMRITKQSGLKVESLICPCKVCGKVMEFPVDACDTDGSTYFVDEDGGLSA